jgi:hypothetical protein
MTSNHDLPADIDKLVANAYEVLQGVRSEDIAAGRIKQRTVRKVEDHGGMFSLTSKQVLDMPSWARGLNKDDSRLAVLHETAKSFAELTNTLPYDVRAIDGWEMIVAIAIALQAYDFATDAEFALDAIQLRVREILMRDSMIERTIVGIFGIRIDKELSLGERSWLLPGTLERRAYLARRDQLTYPLVHSHVYLLSENIATSDGLRNGKRDDLPWQLLSALRSVVRADMRVFGPWFETVVMLPSRFAGFTEFNQAPDSPLSYMYPANDIVVTDALVKETVNLHTLLNGTLPKSLISYRQSLQLAVERLAIAASRDSLSDSLLDLMIALEALLSKQGEKSEITYRIALRGAHASDSVDAVERARARKMLSDTYNLRSEIVHGATSRSDLTPQRISEFRSFVARVIRLNAIALEGGALLVEQLEQALLGDVEAIHNTIAKLS